MTRTRASEKSQRDTCHVIDISLGLGVMMINRATSALPAVDSASHHQHTGSGCSPPATAAIGKCDAIGYVDRLRFNPYIDDDRTRRPGLSGGVTGVIFIVLQ